MYWSIHLYWDWFEPVCSRKHCLPYWSYSRNFSFSFVCVLSCLCRYISSLLWIARLTQWLCSVSFLLSQSWWPSNHCCSLILITNTPYCSLSSSLLPSACLTLVPLVTTHCTPVAPFRDWPYLIPVLATSFSFIVTEEGGLHRWEQHSGKSSKLIRAAEKEKTVSLIPPLLLITVWRGFFCFLMTLHVGLWERERTQRFVSFVKEACEIRWLSHLSGSK